MKKNCKGEFKNDDSIFIVEGVSMTPLIQPKQIIKIRKQEKYNIGDIIVFKYKKKYIVHRILRINKNVVFTKGDHNFQYDRDVLKKNIVGKVIKIDKTQIDSFYWNSLNRVIAFASDLHHSIRRKEFLAKKFWLYLNQIKMRFIGDRKLHIYCLFHLAFRLAYVPYHIVLKGLRKLE